MFSFSIIIFYSAVEISLYLLHGKEVIAAFKPNEKKLGPGTSFREKNPMIHLFRKSSRLEKAAKLCALEAASWRFRSACEEDLDKVLND